MNPSNATIPPAVAQWNKGLGHCPEHPAGSQSESLNWNLLREDLSLPSAVLYQSALQHNLAWMQQFIEAYGMKLAPHGKTTMAPRLFAMQLNSGAWGITLATAHQTLIAHKHGVRRVLMANQLVGRENMAIIARLLEDPHFEYYCLIDSPELVHQLGAFFAERNQRLHLLLELGVEGGRAGIRDNEQLKGVLHALSQWPHSLALCGLEVYEGVLSDEASIRAFLAHAVSVARELLQNPLLARTPMLLSGAGSAWYDVVADVFSSAGFGDSVAIILRPGCYLTHDIGAYREAQSHILERNPIARKMHSGLRPALQLWAYVQSIPEPHKAIIGMGKRDAAFDAGLPVPSLHFRPGRDQAPQPASKDWALTKMMDQHAYMQMERADDLRVSDMIAFDISHPCLTFDKWRTLPILDDNYQVVEVVQTYF